MCRLLDTNFGRHATRGQRGEGYIHKPILWRVIEACFCFPGAHLNSKREMQHKIHCRFKFKEQFRSCLSLLAADGAAAAAWREELV